MINTTFKLINGGLMENSLNRKKEFVSSYITDTRLMGVVGMYIHWRLPENSTIKDLHQFFYLDAEEYGFDTYKSVLGNDAATIKDIENSLIGGLGGQKVPLTEKEALYTIQQYIELSEKVNEPLPEGREEYEFLLHPKIVLSQPEAYILMTKQCVSIICPYEAINYFLMRCFGRDFGAASFLSAKKFQLDVFPEYKAATFYKNNISETDATNIYRCESLIEFDETYHIAVTEITMDGHYISGFRRISDMAITSREAAMQLSRSEFISVYGLKNGIKHNRNITELTKTSMITPHDSGTMYMIFNPHNEHVAQKNYRLNKDVRGMYYFSDSGQLIAAAYSMEEIQLLEKDLKTSSIASDLINISKYEFIEPVLFEFVQSGIDDFEDFVELIKQ